MASYSIDLIISKSPFGRVHVGAPSKLAEQYRLSSRRISMMRINFGGKCARNMMQPVQYGPGSGCCLITPLFPIGPPILIVKLAVWSNLAIVLCANIPDLTKSDRQMKIEGNRSFQLVKSFVETLEKSQSDEPLWVASWEAILGK